MAAMKTGSSGDGQSCSRMIRSASVYAWMKLLSEKNRIIVIAPSEAVREDSSPAPPAPESCKLFQGHPTGCLSKQHCLIGSHIMQPRGLGIVENSSQLDEPQLLQRCECPTGNVHAVSGFIN